MYPFARFVLTHAALPCAALFFLNTMQAAEFSFEQLPPLPPFAGQMTQPGLAGAYAGKSGDVLILGGGANFPEKMPWRGGVKHIWDNLSVLEKTPRGYEWTTPRGGALPRPMGYGMSFSVPQGVLCAGGCDMQRPYTDVFLLTWDKDARAIVKKELPALPRPLAMMGGAVVGQTVYLAGGSETVTPGLPTRNFWALDLAQPDPQWRELPPWDGPARILPVVAEFGGKLYLFSGRTPEPGKPTRILTDAHCFDPATGCWEKRYDVNGWLKDGADGWSVMAGTGWKSGDEILLFGGSRGTYFVELEQILAQIEALETEAQAHPEKAAELRARAETLARRRLDILEKSHPGFAKEILAYNPATGLWRIAGTLPEGSQVTTVAIPWDGGFLIPNGEIRPGVRTPKVLLIRHSR